MKEGTITLGTAGGCEPIEEMGRLEVNGVTGYPCVVDPLATYSLFSVSWADEDGWHYEQGDAEATLYHPQEHRRIPLSNFEGLLICHVAKMTEIETTINGVSLDHL